MGYKFNTNSRPAVGSEGLFDQQTYLVHAGPMRGVLPERRPITPSSHFNKHVLTLRQPRVTAQECENARHPKTMFVSLHVCDLMQLFTFKCVHYVPAL